MSEMLRIEWRDSCLGGMSERESSRTIDPPSVNFVRREVERNENHFCLTNMERRLLRYLIGNSGRVVSRDELLRSVWGHSTKVFTRTVDVHVHSLRHKIEHNSKRPGLIITVRKTGYKFVAHTAECQSSASGLVELRPHSEP